MLGRRLKFEKVDYIDETNLNLGKLALKDRYCCKSFKSRCLTCAGKYDVGILTLVV